jgi:hypothetical protein
VPTRQPAPKKIGLRAAREGIVQSLRHRENREKAFALSIDKDLEIALYVFCLTFNVY